ncbi:hypothetical protein BDL97_08G087600 [Sphagnum fallax]|nr:hypothetical protein BDL97_08G087600 [Sphagnum fallax]
MRQFLRNSREWHVKSWLCCSWALGDSGKPRKIYEGKCEIHLRY